MTVEVHWDRDITHRPTYSFAATFETQEEAAAFIYRLTVEGDIEYEFEYVWKKADVGLMTKIKSDPYNVETVVVEDKNHD